MARVLVIDDEPSVCWAFQQLLKRRGHEALAAGTAEQGLAMAAKERPDLVLLDVRLPGMDGLTALKKLHASSPDTPVVIITAHGTLETAVEAMKSGAFEYLTKPVDIAKAEEVIARALAPRSVSAEVSALRTEVAGKYGFHSLVGKTPEMQEVFKRIGTVCTSDATVLIAGESGTGKELVARAIHHNGPRADRPFEAVNCASLPATLLESELYGHEKGAFTGAIREKPGKFEVADGGTLFLDEIGEVPLALQVKLLRFLEDKRIVRVGGTQGITADVRIIAATNQDLEERIRAGAFREDLYYRLNVVAIALPPLRRRLEDLPILVAHFLETAGAREKEISDSTMEVLREYPWPGNVRELRNAVEHAVVVARGRSILPEHLPEHITRRRGAEFSAVVADRLADAFLAASGGGDGLYQRYLETLEEPLIRRVMETCGGNQVKAAKMLGINRTTLRKKIAQYKLGK